MQKLSKLFEEGTKLHGDGVYFTGMKKSERKRTDLHKNGLICTKTDKYLQTWRGLQGSRDVFIGVELSYIFLKGVGLSSYAFSWSSYAFSWSLYALSDGHVDWGNSNENYANLSRSLACFRLFWDQVIFWCLPAFGMLLFLIEKQKRQKRKESLWLKELYLFGKT